MPDRPLEVLLVEDDDDFADLLRRGVEVSCRLSWHVTRAATLAEARAAAEAQAFDVVLLDLSLPDSRGLQTLAGVGAAAPDSAVVVLTGLDDDEVAQAAIREGAQDFLVKGQTDAQTVARSIRYAIERKKIQRELVAMASMLERANARLQELAHQDPLTGLANRRHFDQTLAAEWSRAGRAPSELSLVLIDIDHFKAYNDHFGHPAGDECLKAVAGALRAVARRGSDLVARFGGEEFAVLLPSTPAHGARVVAEAMRHSVEDLRIPHAPGAGTVVTVSLGFATAVPSAGGDPSALLRDADRALYRAKAQGRNRATALS